MFLRSKTEEVIFHHAAFKGDVDVAEVRRWHLKRGWSDIGYHYIIRLDGSVEIGRDLKYIGAHSKGNNSKTIGILIVGDHSKEPPQLCQLESAVKLFHLLEKKFKKYLRFGYHRNTGDHPCPGILFPRDYFDELLIQSRQEK